MRFDYHGVVDHTCQVYIKVSKGIILDARWSSSIPRPDIDQWARHAIGYEWTGASPLLGIQFKPCPNPEWVPLPSFDKGASHHSDTFK